MTTTNHILPQRERALLLTLVPGPVTGDRLVSTTRIGRQPMLYMLERMVAEGIIRRDPKGDGRLSLKDSFELTSEGHIILDADEKES